ncbi:hypothetical protein ANO11243_060520 [Dothideomycetidae sp. 11243]|nr:hypothetical protein ANO11243_060520 [fungal sp. No.11243]
MASYGDVDDEVEELRRLVQDACGSLSSMIRRVVVVRNTRTVTRNDKPPPHLPRHSLYQTENNHTRSKLKGHVY